MLPFLLWINKGSHPFFFLVCLCFHSYHHIYIYTYVTMIASGHTKNTTKFCCPNLLYPCGCMREFIMQMHAIFILHVYTYISSKSDRFSLLCLKIKDVFFFFMFMWLLVSLCMFGEKIKKKPYENFIILFSNVKCCLWRQRVSI